MLDKVRLKLLYLHEFREEAGEAALRRFRKACLLQTLLLLLAAAVLIITSGGIGIGSTIAVLATPLLWPVLLVRRLDARIAESKLQLLVELPVFVNKLLLYLQSGQTLHNALLRCADSYTDDDPHPLARQLALVKYQLRHSAPFAQAIEGLARRCALQEMTFFTSAILMNYRRGGDELVSALRLLSRDLWEKRKAAVKTLGEQASSKMVFPLVLIFAAIMAAVGAPAMMQMN